MTRTVPIGGSTPGATWRRAATGSLAWLAFGLLVSCDSGGTTADDALDGADGGSDEAAGDDVEVDDGDTDTCDPDCHWDCFGGASCVDGEVWEYGYAPRPCCHFGDPWPGTGPVCGARVLYRCAEGGCAADPRYVSCGGIVGPDWSGRFMHLAPTFCPEGWGRIEGDPCSTDDDCRPVAEGAAPRLRCDTSSSSCAAEDRPAATTGFGASCGLTAADHPDDQLDNREMVVAGSTCDVCFAAWSEAGSCWRQACTIACRFDEDCPEGTVCLCIRWGIAAADQFCAAATDRESSAGRTAGLVCP